MRKSGLIVGLLAALLTACGQPHSASQSTQASPAVQLSATAPNASPLTSASEAAPSNDALAKGAPALWRTGDADTTIYLLGTVHVLPPSLNWRTAVIDKAVSDARAVYFETDLDPSPEQMTAFIGKLGYYPAGETLSGRLDKDQRRALAEAASKLSVSVTQLDTMRPWLAMIALNQPMTLRAGYQPESGVERTLSPIIARQHKEVRKLESVEDQLSAFADLPDKVQIDYLMQSLGDIDRNTELLNALVKAWATGDVAKLEKLLIEDDVGEDPAVEQALLVNRNRNWSVKLDALIRKEPGVFLVAVGAAHLAGKDSLRAMLEAKGYKVDRVE